MDVSPTCTDPGDTVNRFKAVSREKQDLWRMGVFRHQKVMNNVGSGRLRVSMTN